MKIKNWISDRLVQYAVLSAIIGISNFFMITSVYANTILGVNAFIFAPVFIISVFVGSYVFIEKTGFINHYFGAQHIRSPVLKGILDEQKIIREEINQIKEMVKNVKVL